MPQAKESMASHITHNMYVVISKSHTQSTGHYNNELTSAKILAIPRVIKAMAATRLFLKATLELGADFLSDSREVSLVFHALSSEMTRDMLAKSQLLSSYAPFLCLPQPLSK